MIHSGHFVEQIGLVNSVSLLRRDRNEEIQENVVSFKANTREYQVLDFSRILTPGSYYWSLPNEFLGERVSFLLNSLLHSPNFLTTEKENFGKHCRKRRKCWQPAFSPFHTMFSTLIIDRNHYFSNI